MLSNRQIPAICFLAGLISSAHSFAMQSSLDIGISSSSQSESLGLSSHYQMISDRGLGFDVGYDYLNEINYDALDTTLSHSMSQLEAGVLWQFGDLGPRAQIKGSAVFSLTDVEDSGDEVISRFQPGYQVVAGLSAPVYQNFRAFFEAGYQGWVDAEIPSHMRWRYGLRMTFGPSAAENQIAVEQAEQAAAEEQQMLEYPPMTINPAVPEYIPSHLSESLPPIVANSEVCKCSPAGPYTLQLGEFSDMKQAIRGLDYRGLRQFFNSRAYQRTPIPVFLAQPQEAGSVSLYLGEIESLDDLAYWQHELKKNGINARLRKVVDADGQRTANSVVDVDEKELNRQPMYSEEDIRRMNSLPEGSMEELKPEPSASTEQLIAEKEAYDAEMEAKMVAANQLEAMEADSDTSLLQVGPVSQSSLEALLATDEFKRILARDSYIRTPERLNLIWDEGKKEAWLSFSGFASKQHIDEWSAWLESMSLGSDQVEKAFVPMGDVYRFRLAEPLHEYSVEIDRNESIAVMMERLRSPEVLWFHAFQQINEQPVETSLNWSDSDNRYHLIIINVKSQAEQQQIWGDLTAVGLLPSLAEP